MSAGEVIGLGICGFCALIFVVLGALEIRSSIPVEFWAGEKPPSVSQVTDVKAYNKKHGYMWIIYGLGMFAAYLTWLPFENGTVLCVSIIGETFGGLILMILYHNHLYRKYVRK